MSGALSYASVAHCGALRVRGRDAVSFLQGQLSNDLHLLADERSLLAGYHNPQGRVIALMRLIQLAPEDLIAVLPRELLAPVTSRLSKFILRARVQLTDESAAWRLDGLMGPPAAEPATPVPESGGVPLPAAPDAMVRIDGAPVVRLGGEARWLVLSPSGTDLGPPAALRDHAAAAAGEWLRLAVRAGEPQVYAATSEQFVAQMLNLDLLGAIAFDKGCYTGQEVIARAHYRGRVKRRLQRFVSRAPLELRPGDAGELLDGRALRVVEAVSLPNGACEFLAVAPLTAAQDGTDETPVTQSAPAKARRIDAAPLPLPYTIPQIT
jgi:folate-binding protein YgfZ